MKTLASTLARRLPLARFLGTPGATAIRSPASRFAATDQIQRSVPKVWVPAAFATTAAIAFLGRQATKAGCEPQDGVTPQVQRDTGGPAPRALTFKAQSGFVYGIHAWGREQRLRPLPEFSSAGWSVENNGALLTLSAAGPTCDDPPRGGYFKHLRFRFENAEALREARAAGGCVAGSGTTAIRFDGDSATLTQTESMTDPWPFFIPDDEIVQRHEIKYCAGPDGGPSAGPITWQTTSQTTRFGWLTLPETVVARFEAEAAPRDA